MGGVSRHLCWYLRRISFAPQTDTRTQSLIDLAGSEKATSDKERTREGRYINTRLGLLIAAYPRNNPNADRVNPILVKFTHVGKRDFYLGRECR